MVLNSACLVVMPPPLQRALVKGEVTFQYYVALQAFPNPSDYAYILPGASLFPGCISSISYYPEDIPVPLIGMKKMCLWSLT